MALFVPRQVILSPGFPFSGLVNMELEPYLEFLLQYELIESELDRRKEWLGRHAFGTIDLHEVKRLEFLERAAIEARQLYEMNLDFAIRDEIRTDED